NVDFMEAIKILASEAGMQVPAADPRAQKIADKRTILAEVMEQAVQYYRLQLKTAQAGFARDYLTGRGLGEAVQTRFEVGFAPDQRQGLFQHLTGKNVKPEHIIEAGLCAKPDDGGAPYDRFRGRIIFPIRDARGRAIGLGGRAMDPNARAKYLNSPETPLFDKGRSLYNHGPAREKAGKGQPFIVAEGYMDVIALERAGFTAAVAPLGTAITQSQLELMWRISPEPIIALDGDKAGLRAAMRLVDLALPLIGPQRSLRFVLMPEGLDPDDLIKAKGASAMQALLDEAQPLVQLLWQRETEDKSFDSPERRAALDKSLRDAIRKIPDPDLRHHYGLAIKELRETLFRPAKGGERREWTPFQGNSKGGKFNWRKRVPDVTSSAKSSLLVAGHVDDSHVREAVVLATLIATPSVAVQFESDLERLQCGHADHRRILACLLHALHQEPLDDGTALREKMQAEVGVAALEKLFSYRHVQISPAIRHPGDGELAMACVSDEIAKLEARRALVEEVEDAREDLTHLADEGVTWRLSQAAEARNRAIRSEQEDKAVYEKAENGSLLVKEERDNFSSMIEKINFSKKK
ncbi:MAG: DNA primase, partial [Halocynthiibacter sp.]